MTRLAANALLCLALLSGTGSAQETPLALPEGTVETARILEDPGAVRLPTGRHSMETRPHVLLEGRVLLRAYRIPFERGETLRILRALRPQLAAAGFEVIFDCSGDACGGYDFRVANRVLPAPAMELSLTDFRALTAVRDGEAPAHVGIVVSRTPRGGFVQAIEVTPAGAEEAALAVPEPIAPPPTPEAAPVAAPDLAAALARDGRAVLEGVDFATGERAPGSEAVAALAPLAAAMEADPALKVLIVGHTDTVGSLEANIELSRARAEAVRRALVESYGIAPDRLSAAGAGFLAPRAPNDTEEGRARNRRVEAVLR